VGFGNIECFTKNGENWLINRKVAGMTNIDTIKDQLAYTGISFRSKLNGYDKAQVDNYIENLTDAYGAAHDEYAAKCVEYDGLFESFKELELEARERRHAGADAATRTLLDTEILAYQITDNAQDDARRIIEDAHIEAQRIVIDAQDDARTIITDARNDARMIMMEADETIGQMIDEIKQLLAPRSLQAGQQPNLSVLRPLHPFSTPHSVRKKRIELIELGIPVRA